MKRILILPCLAACLAGSVSGPALAGEQLPDSCKPKVAGGALALAGDADAAQLQCDVDRAAILADRSDALFGAVADPLVRIVDTTSPSGAAYVYYVTEDDGAMRLDARSVPADMDDSRTVPVCHLGTVLGDDVSNKVSIALVDSASPDVPGYAERMEVIVNPDGSRKSVLMLDSHDVVTMARTASGARNFSRHIRQTEDIVGKLNELIIGVANVSDGWDCNAS